MKCFVILPLSERDSETFYQNVIKPAVEEFEYNGIKIECYKSNDSHRTGNIVEQIIEGLSESEIVIADLNNKNANVFYELGIRHALRNNTILLANKPDDLIFDITNERVIFCDSKSDNNIIKEKIKAVLKTIITSEKISDSPVRKYLQNKALEKTIYENVIPGLNAVENLLNEFNSLKASFTEQNNQFKNIVQSLSLEQGGDSKTVVNRNETKISEMLVGAWYNDETESFYYSEIVNNKLEFCYCYDNQNKDLTAFYKDIRFFGNIFTAQFIWVNNRISGTIYFKIIDQENLSGGWWYKDDVEHININQMSSINNMPQNSMNPIELSRIKNLTFENYPDWAKEYFNNLKK